MLTKEYIDEVVKAMWPVWTIIVVILGIVSTFCYPHCEQQGIQMMQENFNRKGFRCGFWYGHIINTVLALTAVTIIYIIFIKK